MLSVYKMFRSETDKFRERVQKVILSKKEIAYKPWVDSVSLSQYGPKRLFASVLVLSTKTLSMIAMSNPLMHFLLVVYRLKLVEQAVDLVMSLCVLERKARHMRAADAKNK
jgi:hypothetical protein